MLFLLSFLGKAITYGRSSTWTVVLALNARGMLVQNHMVILRSDNNTVDVDIAAEALKRKLLVGTSPKGIQSDQTWNACTNEFIKVVKTVTPRDPGIVFFDGHFSHLTEISLNQLAKYSLQFNT